jgi:hypothetical protein
MDIAYRDKKEVVGVFVRFRAPALLKLGYDYLNLFGRYRRTKVPHLLWVGNCNGPKKIIVYIQ